MCIYMDVYITVKLSLLIDCTLIHVHIVEMVSESN